MTKSKTKLLTSNLKGTVKRSVIRKAVEKVYGIKADASKVKVKKEHHS